MGLIVEGGKRGVARLKKTCLRLVVIFHVSWLGLGSAMAATYYVSPSGSDRNSGLSEKLAFATLQHAVSVLNPGDTLLALSGTYRNADYAYAGHNEYVAWLTRSGTPDAWITIRAAPGATPSIVFNGWGGFGTQNAQYIEINGFQITGNNAKITYAYAYSQRTIANPSCNGSGIVFDGRNQGTNHPHHIRILNNVVSECGGTGISAIQCDYVTIAGNRVFDNCWYNIYGNSGISCYQNWRFDSNTGYKMIIRGNVLYNNHGLIPWIQTGQLSDGNGIIIDDSLNTQNGSTLGPYTGRTLVANNLSVNNGGSGMHAFSSEHVDFINNTTWHNSQVLAYGEIFGNSSDDVNILNNICVAATGKPMNTAYGDTNVTSNDNIYFGGEAPVGTGPQDQITDPMLVNPQTDPTQGDFGVQPGSPALSPNAGSPVIIGN
jgi:hypothetical protein